MQLTAHAGEEGDHTFVERSLDKLKVTRIDHGVNSQHSESLLQRLNEKQIMLSLCPLSNVKLQVVQDVGHLPIDLFLKKGSHFLSTLMIPPISVVIYWIITLQCTLDLDLVWNNGNKSV